MNVLREPAFLEGDTTTDFIDRVEPARTIEHNDEALTRLAQVAALWVQGENRAKPQSLDAAPSGW